MTIEIKSECSNSDDMIIFIEFIKYTSAFALRVLILRLYHKNLAVIITSANADWSVTKKPKFWAIMRSYAYLGNVVLYTQFTSGSIVVLIYIVGNLPFLQPGVQSNSTNTTDDVLFERMFPQGTKCLFKDVSTTTYVFIYILQSFQIICLIFGTIAIDAFFFSLAMHICGQFETLREEISDFEEGDDFIETELRIVATIKRHQHLLKVAQHFETAFNLIIAVQLVTNIAGICEFGIITFIFIIVNFYSFMNLNIIVTQLN